MQEINVHYDLVYLICARVVKRSRNMEDLERNYDWVVKQMQRIKKDGCPMYEGAAEILASLYLDKHIALECDAYHV